MMGAPAGAPGGATTGAAGTADSGAVSNAQSTESTTTTTTSSSGLAPDGTSVSGGALDNSDVLASDSGAMPNTGGEPVLMSLMGLSLALGAFAVRKRIAA